MIFDPASALAILGLLPLVVGFQRSDFKPGAIQKETSPHTQKNTLILFGVFSVVGVGAALKYFLSGDLEILPSTSNIGQIDLFTFQPLEDPWNPPERPPIELVQWINDDGSFISLPKGQPPPGDGWTRHSHISTSQEGAPSSPNAPTAQDRGAALVALKLGGNTGFIEALDKVVPKDGRPLEVRIREFLNKLDTSFTDGDTRRVEALVRYLENRAVINPKNITEEIINGRNEWRAGQGLAELTPEQMKDQIINAQKASLRVWVEYLFSPEARTTIDPAYRYWLIHELLGTGSKTPDGLDFFTRSKTTLAEFPTLNQQALAHILSDLEYHQSFQQPPWLPDSQSERYADALHRRDFKEMYAIATKYIVELKTHVYEYNNLLITDGEWRVFEKGSDPQALIKTLSPFNTGWCVAGEGHATSYLAQFDLHVLYVNVDGYHVPRAVISVDPDTKRITELRGIIPGSGGTQHLDGPITPIVEAYLKTNPALDVGANPETLKQITDMSKLTDIYARFKNDDTLTKDDLRFLYEVDRKIASTGYGRDPRIEHILTTRNVPKDLAFIFNVDEPRISFTPGEAGSGTSEHPIEFHYGSLDISESWEHPPKIVGGDMTVSQKSLSDFSFPRHVVGSVYCPYTESATNVKFPETIRGSLYLPRLTSLEKVILPHAIDGNLLLSQITSLDGMSFPQMVGGNIFIESAHPSENVLPDTVTGEVYVSSNHLDDWKGMYPHIKFVVR